MPRQFLLVLLLAFVWPAYIIPVEAVNGMADKGTKDEPLPKDNPLDYARSKGAVAATQGAPSKIQPAAGKSKPAPAGKSKPAPAGKSKPAPTGKTTAKVANAKSKPAPLDESAYITNVNSIGEEDPSGKKKNKVAAATSVPIESATVAPSVGKH